MRRFTTNEIARLLGTTGTSLVRYMKKGKIPLPEVIQAGKATIHSWSEADIERLRKLLPKIKNGRKTRYQKKQMAHGTPGSTSIGNKQIAKAKSKAKKKPQPELAVPHKKKKK